MYWSRMCIPGNWEISWQQSLITRPLLTPHLHKIFRLSYGPALKSALLWKLIICSKSGNLTWQSNLHAREPVHYYMMFVVVVTFLYYCCRHIYGSYMSVSKSQVEILSHGKAFHLEFTFHFVFSYEFGGSAIILKYFDSCGISNSAVRTNIRNYAWKKISWTIFLWAPTMFTCLFL